MDLQTLTQFFMWCTIINGSLLMFWTLMSMFAPHLLYKTQQKWFPLSPEHFKVVFYGFLGLFKIFFLFLNLVPYCALLIIG